MKNAIDAAMLLMKKDDGRIDSVENRVGLLFRLTQGEVWDTETDSDAAYRKAVPSGAAAAEIGSIGGQTVLWNQMVKNGNFDDAGNWSREKSTIAVADHVCAITLNLANASAAIYQAFPIPPGHKIFAALRAKSDDEMSIRASLNTSSINTDTIIGLTPLTSDFSVLRGILTATEASGGLRIGSSAEFAVGSTYSVRDISVIDLTVLGFGDIASVDDPRIAAIEAYAALHPAYQTGEPVSAEVTAIVSKDADAETLGSMEIPAAVRALEGYGQSAVGGSGNTLNLTDGTYTEIGHYVDGVWTLLDAQVVTDVSAYLPDNMLDVEAGGSLTFVQEETELPIPNSVDYLIKLSEVTP